MKKINLLLMALLAIVGGANAKTFETTLWEGTYNGEVELNAETVATFKAGDVLRVFVTTVAQTSKLFIKARLIGMKLLFLQ